MILSIKHKVLVQNRKGHGYSGSNFLEYWENEKKMKASTCARIGCDETAACGGHVYKPGEGPKPHYYIVPLCSSCNHTEFKEGYHVYNTDMVDAPTQD